MTQLFSQRFVPFFLFRKKKNDGLEKEKGLVMNDVEIKIPWKERRKEKKKKC